MEHNLIQWAYSLIHACPLAYTTLVMQIKMIVILGELGGRDEYGVVEVRCPWWCMVAHGGAWWCMMEHGGAWWCMVEHGGARWPGRWTVREVL